MQYPIYLDNQATTPLDPRVLEAMLPVFQAHYGNPASSTHAFGWYAEELVTLAREQVAALIGAPPKEIIFTSGATEANNLVCFGLAKALLKTDRASNCELLSLVSEHRSILEPLTELEASGFVVTLLEVDQAGLLDLDLVLKKIGPHTKLVSIMLANNEIGVIQDLQNIFAAIKARYPQVLCHSDITAAVGKIPVDATKLSADFLSFSAHKIYGPKGVGALYLKDGPQRQLLTPLTLGGGHEGGLRSGTLNVPAIVGFAKACALIQSEFKEVSEHLRDLTTLFLAELEKHGVSFQMNGSPIQRIPGNLNLSFPGTTSAKLLPLLSSRIALSTSSACSSGTPSHVLKALALSSAQVDSALRIGIGRFNTKMEIVEAAQLLAVALAKAHGQSS